MFINVVATYLGKRENFHLITNEDQQVVKHSTFRISPQNIEAKHSREEIKHSTIFSIFPTKNNNFPVRLQFNQQPASQSANGKRFGR